jgi:environmental stress-induced protein Ves
MSYNIEVIRKNEHKTSGWSGGTTTELYIYPKDSLYSHRNFKWRLSSAKVEIEQSTFTSLPAISRLIMVIEGELLLQHEGHHNIVLKAFEQDSFSGEWTTTSFGKVTDFNLMTAQDYKGKLESILVNRGEFKDILFQNNINDAEKFHEITEAFYIVKGDVKIVTEAREKINLKEGDLALVTRTEKEDTAIFNFWNCGDDEVKIIRTSIYH